MPKRPAQRMSTTGATGRDAIATPRPRPLPCPILANHLGEKVAFGLLTQLVLEGQPQSEINEIPHDQKAVGLPITLAQVGVDANNDDQLQRIAARGVIPGESSPNEPFPVTAEAVVAALNAADPLGRGRPTQGSPNAPP